MLIKTKQPSIFNLVDHFFDDSNNNYSPYNKSFFSPDADIIEDEKQFSIRLDLPGVDKKDISLKIDDSYLIIEGQRKNEKQEEDKESKSYSCEIEYGSFKRSWKINEKSIDTDNIKAKLKDGVFHVNLPKSKEVQNKTKSISID